MLTAIEEQLSKSGNHVATVYKGRRRSFGELDLHSRRLADALQVPPDTAPGLAACIADADNMVIAFLASLRISTSCTPLRASSSPAELASVLKELRPRLVLVDSTTASHIPQDQKTVNIEEYLRQEGSTEPKTPHHESCPPGGSEKQVSTQPLLQFLHDESGGGSSLSAERCLNRHQWEWKEWPAMETVAVLDDVDSARFWEDVLSALCSGWTVALASKEEKLSPNLLLQFLRDASATRIETTPDTLWALLKRASMEREKSPLPRLHLVKCSRGLVSTELVSLLHHVLPQTRLAYVYEHAGHSCVYQCPADIEGLRHHRIANGDFVVLGKPVGGCRVVVRGANRTECPQGVTGALCLGSAKGGDEVPTGDIGFVDSDGYIVLTSATTPSIDGRKVDMALIRERIKDTPFVTDAELCWEYTTSGRTTLVAFYWTRAGGDRSGELFHHLYPTVPYHWVPRFFPLGPPPPAGQRPGADALLGEYSAAVGKLLSCGEPNALRGAPVLVAIARSLKIPVAQIDANASYSSQASGKGAASAAKTSALLEHIGYEVSVAALEGPQPLSKLVEDAACSLVLPGLRKVRVSTLDANTPFDEVAALEASCFTAKNRLCTTMGLTREEFVDYLRHLWPQFVADAATPLVRDESGRLVAAAISGDFGAEFPLPGNISEAFVIVLEINDVLERRLRALTCDHGRRMLLCFMVGCSLENKSDDNIGLVQLLYANVLRNAKRLGYGGASSTNSHVVTNIATQRWFDFFIFDNAVVADFEYQGRRPFASVQPGTLITSVCKFLERPPS